MEQEKTRMTFREWIENYWYHYKWPTQVGGLFLFILLVCIVQCSTRIMPDVILMYSGPKSLPFESISGLETAVTEVMEEDFNGDGTKYVQYLENVILLEDYSAEDYFTGESVEVSQAQQSEQVQNYVTHVVAGDAQIYLASPEIFRELLDQHALVALDTVYGTVPVEANDDYSFALGELGIHSLPGFCELPADTLLCLRVTKTIGVRDARQAENEHAWAESVFRSLVAYQPS